MSGSEESEDSSKFVSAEDDLEYGTEAEADVSSSSGEGYTGFDVLKLNQHLRLCLRELGRESSGDYEDVRDGVKEELDLLMDEYIQIFHQLYKFFCMLGAVFGFVGSDVKLKVNILETYRKGDKRDHYVSLKGMLSYEKDSGYLSDNRNGNGSRTFLRLHRALVFVYEFLNRTLSLNDEEGTCGIAREAYNDTLAKYHPWLIRKGALMAMYSLPTKKQLFKQVSGSRDFSRDELQQMLEDAIKMTQEIYEHSQELYAQHELLNLP